MIRWIAHIVLKILGWNTSGKLPPGVDKAIMIVAPHTSYWDFVIGRLTFWASGVKVKFLIKKEVFFFPLGWFLKRIGGIPVERGRTNNIVEEAVRQFNNNKKFVLVITPEGTRHKVKQWKKGFYIIAERAKVPVALAYIDYGKHTGGVGPLIYPSGNYNEDIIGIRKFYNGMTPKHPERFILMENTSDEV